MGLIKKMYESIMLIDKLITSEQTGTPAEFAEKMDVSERQLYNYLRSIRKNFKAPIKYDPEKRSYVYTEEGHIFIGFHLN